MIYLDNAATTFPKPESVYAKMDDCMRNYCANPGRSGHKMAMESARVVEETRDIIAKLFNIKNPMDVVYTFNATDSLNLAIKGFLKPGDHVITTTMEHNSIIAKLFNIKNPMDVVYTFNATDSLNLAIKGFLKPGDHVITTTMEHNSVLRPIMELENIGVEHTFVQADEEGRIDPKDVETAIKDNTKLIAIIHASNVTGTLIDIETIGKIAKNHGITYLVDASQSAGIYDIDVDKLNIDMLAMPGHN